ncbi:MULTISPECIES: hypothetical protein [Asticcacaulis]|uniref:hypothetical protein n=1 Tax=Asticcacaulis TaxID=76890 RepID=UPI001AE8E67E|nr:MULTISPECIES: hypothetical protein [Asticcacaulis]MBP2157571.1 hypothetical protein [Asticcacaulis solisilvae]MDR6798616.1 hypothetical protein [Asticcacaulis sp. BE141]
MMENVRPGGRDRWKIAVWAAAAGLWLTPLIAMRFTNEVVWDAFDFAVFGAMLLSVCGLLELATRMSRSVFYRLGFALALVAGFVLIWMNLAVGIIGSEDNPTNLMYAGVLAIGAAGAVLARLKPQGMAIALVVMAVAQGLVSATAVLSGYFTVPLDAAFIAVWLLSAWLFHTAARQTM